MFDTDISTDQDDAYSERPLHLEAATDLRETLEQFRLSTIEIGRVIFHLLKCDLRISLRL
jgi:hypothetical protein